MAQKKIDNYGLYQTVSDNIPTEPLSKIDEKNLLKHIDNSTKEQKEAFLMLICEHARLKDDFKYNSDEFILPYSIKQEENNISVDFSKIPEELQWILWKFFNIISVSEEK